MISDHLSVRQHFKHPLVNHTGNEGFSACPGEFFTCQENKLTSFNGTTCLIPGMCRSEFIVGCAVKSLMKALTGEACC